MKKVMICDDDEDIVSLIEILLTSMQLEYSAFSTISNVEELVKSEKPDLILMDLWIPEIGGQEATSRLKNDPELKEVPVLLFSASDKIEEICEECNADGYISKPFDVAAFKEIVSKYLN